MSDLAETHQIPGMLRLAYLSMHRQTNAHLAELGVTADQFVCLMHLKQRDGMIQRELVRRASSDPNTIRAMLLLLEKRGLVSREVHPADRRSRVVRLTQQGHAVFDELVEVLAPVRARLDEAFTQEEARLLNQLLKLVTEAMTVP